ncbi:MAG: hypothetical protein AAB478_01105 [Patescibacteria group bacterium]
MKKTQQKNLLFIVIPSTILIILWIIFGVYNRAVTSTISSSQQIAINPIAPVFDTSVLELLKKRAVVTPLLTGAGQTVITPASEAAGLTEEVPPEPVATESAKGEELPL